MRVDQSGQDELAGRVDRLVRLRLDHLIDGRDSPPLDQHITRQGSDLGIHRDDVAATDEDPPLTHGACIPLKPGDLSADMRDEVKRKSSTRCRTSMVVRSDPATLNAPAITAGLPEGRR